MAILESPNSGPPISVDATAVAVGHLRYAAALNPSSARAVKQLDLNCEHIMSTQFYVRFSQYVGLRRCGPITVVGVICVCASLFQPAVALDNTWIFNGDGNWDDGPKWSFGIPAQGAGVTAVIDDGDTAVTVTMDTSHSIDALSLDTDDTLLIQANSSNVTLTSANGFTNNGTIRLTSVGSGGGIASLSVSSGTLTNSATGLIDFQAGADARGLTADLVNNGTVTVNHDVPFDKFQGSYTNNASLSVSTGNTLTMGNASTLNQNGGTFTLNGTLNSGTFTHNSGTFAFGSGALVQNLNYNYLGGTITGTPTLHNTTLVLGPGTNPASFLMDQGNVLASDVRAGQTITVQSNSNSVTLSNAGGFTNNGTIRFTSIGTGGATSLTVNGGTLTNSATGLIDFQAGTEGQDLSTDLVNNGTVTVNHNVSFEKFQGNFTNNSLLTVGGGKTLSISNAGTLTNYSGTTLTGGTYDLSGTLKLPSAFIQTNQAELILRGGTIADSSNNNALANLSVNGTSGKLRVLGGASFSTQVSTFTNDGLIELGGGSFHVGLPFSGGHGDFINSSTGQIIGSGAFGSSTAFGSFTNAGLISPGTSPGIVQLADEYTQTATGTLRIGINGNNNSDPQNPQFDVLKVSDVATLGGTLTLAIDGSFTPSFNDVFTVFDAFSFTGAFANIANGQRLATTGGEGSFVVTYNAGIGDVILSSFAINGDYNANGVVDAGDYVLWRKSPASYGGAGGYNTWRSNFGRTNIPGSGSGAGGLSSQTAVPEPSCFILLVAGVMLLACRCRSCFADSSR
jgi:hypothetical protein